MSVEGNMRNHLKEIFQQWDGKQYIPNMRKTVAVIFTFIVFVFDGLKIYEGIWSDSILFSDTLILGLNLAIPTVWGIYTWSKKTLK